MHSLIHLYMHQFAYSFIHPPTYTCMHVFIPSFIHPTRGSHKYIPECVSVLAADQQEDRHHYSGFPYISNGLCKQVQTLCAVHAVVGNASYACSHSCDLYTREHLSQSLPACLFGCCSINKAAPKLGMQSQSTSLTWGEGWGPSVSLGWQLNTPSTIQMLAQVYERGKSLVCAGCQLCYVSKCLHRT